MPVEQTIKAVPADGSKYITIKDIEDLCIAARHRGAEDDALLGVNLPLEIRSPARVVEAFIEWK